MTTAVYFDLDGTLVSSTVDEELPIVADEFDLAVDDDAVHLFNALVRQYFQRNIPDGYYRAVKTWRTHYEEDFDADAFTEELKHQKVENTVLNDGVTSLLDDLADDVPIGLLTNGAGDIQHEKLEKHGLSGYFDPILISGEIATMKPNDAIYRLAKDEVPADRHVYVADRLADDIVSAQENEFVGVFVSEEPSPLADITVESIEELTVDRLLEDESG